MESLSGIVTKFIFKSNDNEFAVALLKSGNAGRVKVSGPIAEVNTGEEIEFSGEWFSHPKHGETFKVAFVRQEVPNSKEGYIKFLSSDLFPGIGKNKAKAIVKTFGEELEEVIEFDYERLAEIKGVSDDLAERIHDIWMDNIVLSYVSNRVGEAGGTMAQAKSIRSSFGSEAKFIVDNQPYSIVRVPRVGWKLADAIAMANGVEADDPMRIATLVSYHLVSECDQDGSTCLALGSFAERLQLLLAGEDFNVQAAIGLAVDEGLVTTFVMDNESYVAPTIYWRVEETIANEIDFLIRNEPRDSIPKIEVDSTLTDEQTSAVYAVLENRISVLTGGPGTGKTTTIKAVVSQAEAAGWDIALCAPTGRAAKRLEELTGHKATTVHRLLGAQPSDSGGFRWTFNEDNRLPFDFIVCDEWSMADIFLTKQMLVALPAGARLLLVGDKNQLPSVSNGAVLRDLGDIDGLHLTNLTKVHRQAKDSRIISLAHEINQGTVVEPVADMREVFVVPEESQNISARVAEIVSVKAPPYFGCSPSDIQVLSCMYRGSSGVDELNTRLRQALNPAENVSSGDEIDLRDGLYNAESDAAFRSGDRVMVTRNDVELDVSNGDIGSVRHVSDDGKNVIVDFPYGERTFEGSLVDLLSFAWAVTVHKSQGGEWPIIVLVLDSYQSRMLNKSLLYTAVTRAKKGLLIVGSTHLLAWGAKSTTSDTNSRKTTILSHFE